ncbi:unnamed protein product [Blepharisma stoltei]|uniref:Uncharacterized protein n=1 Tax=Blepharisma stoltei TaxID=1481888 RepID=A0AAU9JNM4_9CILI|nr:unnamed protein product [Blepharisma stoltei]
METIKKEITDLCSSLIENHSCFEPAITESEDTRKFLINRMLKLKSIQSIILEAVAKLHPIITEFLVKQKFGEYLTRSTLSTSQTDFTNHALPSASNGYKTIVNKSEQKLMTKNYEKLQDKVSIITEIFKEYAKQEIEKNQSILPEGMKKEIAEEKVLSSDKLVEKLTEMNNYDLPFYLDIRDISHDAWERHVEVEKEFVDAIENAKNQLIEVETKYMYKFAWVKEKAGIKIHKLEEKEKEIVSKNREEYDRIMMCYQDKLSGEIENYLREEAILTAANNDEKVTDLPSAQKKIQNLIAARTILEKKIMQSDKTIKGFETRIQVANQNLKELTASQAATKNNLNALKETFTTIIDLAPIKEIEKEKLADLVEKENYENLEENMKGISKAERKAQEYLIGKLTELKESVGNISSKIENKEISAEIGKILEDVKIDEVYLESEKIRQEKLAKPEKTETKKILKPRRSTVIKGQSAQTPKLDESPIPYKKQNTLMVRREDINLKSNSLIRQKEKEASQKLIDNSPSPENITNQEFTPEDILDPKKEQESIFRHTESLPLTINSPAIKTEKEIIKIEKKKEILERKIIPKEDIRPQSQNLEKIEEKTIHENSPIIVKVEEVPDIKVETIDETIKDIKPEEENVKEIKNETEIVPKIVMPQDELPSPASLDKFDNVVKSSDELPSPLKIEITTKKESKDSNYSKNSTYTSSIYDNRTETPDSIKFFKEKLFKILSHYSSEKLSELNINSQELKLSHLLEIELSQGLSLQEKIFSALRDFFSEKSEISVQTDGETKLDNLNASYGNMIKGLIMMEKRNKERKDTQNSLTRGSRANQSVVSSGVLGKLSTSATEKIENPASINKPSTLIDWVKKINNRVEEAYQRFNAEFAIEAQKKGYKKVGLEESNRVWADIINRRVQEGENDEISQHLRGLLGTEKYETQKRAIISLLQQKYQKGISVVILGIPQEVAFPEIIAEKRTKKKIPQRLIQKWEQIMIKIKSESARRLGSGYSLEENLPEIWCLMIKHIKYVKYRILRLQGLHNTSVTSSDRSSEKNSFLRGKFVTQSFSPKPPNTMEIFPKNLAILTPSTRQTPKRQMNRSYRHSSDTIIEKFDLNVARKNKFPYL